VESYCYTAIATVNWWDSMKGQFHNVHHASQKCWVEIKLDSINAYDMEVDERAPSGFQKKPLSMPLLSVVLDIDKPVADTHSANVDLTLSGKFREQSHLSRRLLRSNPRDESILLSFRLNSKNERDKLFIAVAHVWRQGQAIRNQTARIAPRVTGTQSYEQQQDDLARKQKTSRIKGFFGRGSKGSKSFRKTNTRSGSTVGNTDASYRTDSSLRRGYRKVKNVFGKSNNIDVERSSVISKSQGGRYPAASSSPEDAFFKTIDSSKENPIRNTFSCQVYCIRNNEKRSMGDAVLYVLSPPTVNGEIVNINGPAGRHNGQALRIALSTQTHIIEDCVLPPSAFTHVNKGINIQVYEEKDGGNVIATGGVGSAKTHTYFIRVSLSTPNYYICIESNITQHSSATKARETLPTRSSPATGDLAQGLDQQLQTNYDPQQMRNENQEM
jgi:hypothetical protein